MPITVRPVTVDELRPWLESLASTFFVWPNDPEASAKLPWVQEHLDRRLAAFDDDHIVATYRSFPTQLTLPGGAALPASGIAAVTTLPTHRRQGILTRLIERDIADTVARGEPASVLHAAEWPIYGRFGYGPATFEGSWTLRTRAVRIIPEAWGSTAILSARAARPILQDVFERHRLGQPGEIARPAHFWDVDLGLVEVPARPRWKGQVAIHYDTAGTPDGYVRYTGEEHWEEGIPDNIANVADLVATSPEAELELWRFLASLDLVATVKAGNRRVNEPWRWALADARAAQLTRANDGVWLRPYDVPALLGARSYELEADVVLEVTDRLGDADGPAAGRYRLETGADGANCTRTDAAPDLSIPVAALGAALLGGTRLVDAARAGGAVEHRPGALLDADRLFRTAGEPWCSTFF